MTSEPLTQKGDILAIKNFFLKNGQFRDHAMFVLGINLPLRISTLLSLRWGDLVDGSGSLKEKIVVTQKRKFSDKTESFSFALSENVKDALRMFLEREREEGRGKNEGYVFRAKSGGVPDQSHPITRFRAFQIMKRAAAECGIEGKFDCRTMKRTFGYWAGQIGEQNAYVIAGMDL